MAEVVYFISDAHLGSGPDSRERELQLCRWLDAIAADCTTLVLLGDMFDFWFTYRHVVPRGNVRLLGSLARLADRGVDVHFFVGNHDMWVFDYLTAECGLHLHDDPALLTLGGRRFLLGHGDGLGHTDRRFDLAKRIFRSRLCQRLFAALPSSLTFPIARRWSEGNKRRHESEDCWRYLGDDREGIVIYCRQQLPLLRPDYCIFGHRHTPLVRPIAPGCTYLNTGDWLRHRSYARFDAEAGRLELLEYNG